MSADELHIDEVDSIEDAVHAISEVRHRAAAALTDDECGQLDEVARYLQTAEVGDDE